MLQHLSCHTLTTATLSVVDVCMQPLYGFGGKDPARFAKAAGHQDLLYVHDPELSFEQVQLLCPSLHAH